MARYRQAPKCPYCQQPYRPVLDKDMVERKVYGDAFRYWKPDCDCKSKPITQEI